MCLPDEQKRNRNELFTFIASLRGSEAIRAVTRLDEALARESISGVARVALVVLCARMTRVQIG
jgi:hypothetical protein